MTSSTLHPSSMRSLSVLPALVCALSLPGRAQAPATAPLILLLPSSTRAAALGNSGVTGRDDDVVFSNPAQLLGARTGFSTTIARYGSAGTFGEMSASYAGGPLTMGWGVEYLDFSVHAGDTYPYVPAMLVSRGPVEAQGLLATVGGAYTWKGFKGGLAMKYVADRVDVAAPGAAGAEDSRHDTFLGDAGLAHNLWGGVAGLAVQNIGRGWTDGSNRIYAPFQESLGWSRGITAGELDLGFSGEVTARRGWVSPGAGVEVGYGWIEGYSAALRAGARRTETSGEKPVALGATFNADRLTIEYALEFFDGGNNAHRVTLRWR